MADNNEARETQARHTAGQWLVAIDPVYTADLAIQSQVDGNTVHIALVNGVDLDQEETEANAALIVAAPELLTALRAFIQMEEDVALSSFGTHVGDGRIELKAQDWLDADPVGFDLVQRGKAAIAKAEGRQS